MINNTYELFSGLPQTLDIEKPEAPRPILKNQIHETRARFLELESVYKIDELVMYFENPDLIIPENFVFFRTDLITNNTNVKGNLEFKICYKTKNKFYFAVEFGKVSNRVNVIFKQFDDADGVYISNFLNASNSFGSFGLGSTIMSFIKTLAVRLQADIRLDNSNEESLKFYKKEGFELEYEYGDELIWKWNREKLKQDSIYQ